MSILDTFFILFDSDASKLDKGLSDSDKKATGFLDKLRKVDAEASKTGATFRDMVGKLAGLAGVGLSFGALVHGIKATADQYRQLEMLAAQFRSTVEEIDEFRNAAGLLGITEEKSTESLHGLERAVQDTAMGLGRAQKVFEELNISVKDGSGNIKSTTAIMGELAGKFEHMDRGKQIRVMERLGLDPALLKLFNSDLGALQRRMADVDRAAGFNLQTAVKRANEYTKASKELGVELNTLKLYLVKLAESFAIASMPMFTKAIQFATEYTAKFVQFLMQHSHFVEGFMVAAGAAIMYFLVPAAINGAIAVWAMIAPFALVGAAALAVGAIFALLYDDVVNFLEGNDSLIGDMLQRWPIIGEVLGNVGAVLKWIGQTVWDVARIFGAAFGMATDAVGSFIADGLEVVVSLLEKVADFLTPFTSAFTMAGKAIGDVIQWLIDKVSAFLDAFGGIVGLAKSVGGAISGALDTAKGALGIDVTAGTLPPETAQGVLAGRAQLAAASASPLASTTSNVINQGGRKGGDTTVTVDKVEVHTQATDAAGISQSIGTELGSHLRKATSQYDDGVAA